MVLQSIRDKLSGIIAVFVLGLLIIPFAFVGVSSYFTSDAVNSVAVVNDQEISINDFNSSFQNYRLQMQRFMGTNFDPEQFDQPIVRRQHLDTMIDQELLAQVSAESGLSVDDERLAQAIREIGAFQVDGEFNADVYQSRLQAQGSTPRQFENQMRAQLILNQYPSTITGSAIATQWELDEYVRLQDQTRAYAAIIVPAEIAGEEGPAEDEAAEDAEATEADEDSDTAPAQQPDESVDEAAIAAWYEAHQDDYYSEEQVVVEYLELDAATMGGDIAPDEEQLRQSFEEQKGRFITPEARLASHILIEVDSKSDDAEIEIARQRAEELAVRARDGEDFAELAMENSEDSGSASDGGDLGWVEPGFMVQAFEDALYELSMENPVSAPVQTGFGWHVILLREIRPSEGMSFAEAREILEEEYRAEAEERRFLEQADRLIDIIYEDPTTLDAAAEDLGLEVLEAGPFGRGGGDEGIAANPEFVKAAFSDLVLLQGAVSDPVDIGTNHLVMLRLKEHMPQALMPLEEVRDQVVAAVRRERAMEAARATAEALLAELEGGADLSELAEAGGFEISQSEGARRNQPGMDPGLREQLFKLDAPSGEVPVTAVVPLDDGYAVVRLDSVADGSLSEEEALRGEAYKRRLAQTSASAEAVGFLKMLRSQSEIEVFEDRL